MISCPLESTVYYLHVGSGTDYQLLFPASPNYLENQRIGVTGVAESPSSYTPTLCGASGSGVPTFMVGDIHVDSSAVV